MEGIGRRSGSWAGRSAPLLPFLFFFVCPAANHMSVCVRLICLCLLWILLSFCPVFVPSDFKHNDQRSGFENAEQEQEELQSAENAKIRGVREEEKAKTRKASLFRLNRLDSLHWLFFLPDVIPVSFFSFFSSLNHDPVSFLFGVSRLCRSLESKAILLNQQRVKSLCEQQHHADDGCKSQKEARRKRETEGGSTLSLLVMPAAATSQLFCI